VDGIEHELTFILTFDGILCLTLWNMASLSTSNSWVWSLIACAVAALAEGVLAGKGVKARFAELRLPTGTPRLWAWSVIGAAYYVLFFVLLKSLLSHPPGSSYWTLIALALSAVLLTANAVWNWIFFRRKDCWLSFAFFAPYLLSAFILAAVLHRIRSPMFGWYAIYLAYLLYATWWGYRVWLLNRGSVK
jgi:tryptophan-rich sensory protein